MWTPYIHHHMLRGCSVICILEWRYAGHDKCLDESVDPPRCTCSAQHCKHDEQCEQQLHDSRCGAYVKDARAKKISVNKPRQRAVTTDHSAQILSLSLATPSNHRAVFDRTGSTPLVYAMRRVCRKWASGVATAFETPVILNQPFKPPMLTVFRSSSTPCLLSLTLILLNCSYSCC